MYIIDLNSKLIILLLIITIFSAYYIPKKYKGRSIFIICIIFFIVFIYINNRPNAEGFTGKKNSCNNLYNWSIGPYSDLTLQPYKSISDQFPLVDPSKIKVYQANGLPLEDDEQPQDDTYNPEYPTVDGTKDGLKNNFMFAYNQSSPLCCPSPYSTSTGCVCLTENQRAFIGNRGTMYGK